MNNDPRKSLEEQSNGILDFHQKAIESLKQTKSTANRQLEAASKNFPQVLADHALGKASDLQLNQALEEMVRLKELASISNRTIETACNAVVSIQRKAFRNLEKECKQTSEEADA